MIKQSIKLGHIRSSCSSSEIRKYVYLWYLGTSGVDKLISDATAIIEDEVAMATVSAPSIGIGNQLLTISLCCVWYSMFCSGTATE